MNCKPVLATALLLLSLIACNDQRKSSRTVMTDSAATQNLEMRKPPETLKTADNEESKVTPPVIVRDEEINAIADPNTEEYAAIVENDFQSPAQSPLSTFSIDVDEASYSNVRRYIMGGELPPPGAVRTEEMINYFDYVYPQPASDQPFEVITEAAPCPWNKEHRLVHIGLQGRIIPTENLPPSNMVFLIDVSGSMDEPNKLPLVQTSMRMLIKQLRAKDKVAIVVYAGNAGLVLPSTSGDEKEKILAAIDDLQAGGSTAGGEGIQLAYKEARKHFMKEGNNRIILATDGDFNVGLSSDDEMVRLIEKERGSGIFLSVLGFGMGNYKDSKMQLLADKGNGNHSYIDNIQEAQKVLVNEFGSTLFTIAKDVKIQVEFNPALVAGYRLIGYENRLLASEDFNDDTRDAGELGSGHTVTALYEVIPVGVKSPFIRSVDPLKYQSSPQKEVNSSELMTIKLRYKKPLGEKSERITRSIANNNTTLAASSENFRFAASVAAFGLLLRQSNYKQEASYDMVLALARSAKGADDNGYRGAFIQLVQSAASLAKK